MSLTGIRDVDIEILLNLTDSELPQVCAVNKYVNSICEDDKFWYRRIINKISKVKEYNFSKVKGLGDIPITADRIREMQKYFGFEKLKDLNNFLNKLPVNALYQEYFSFDFNRDERINQIYEIDMHRDIFPEYIDQQKLIYTLRRNYIINNYKLLNNSNKLQHKSFSFNLPVKERGTRINPELFEVFQKMGIF